MIMKLLNSYYHILTYLFFAFVQCYSLTGNAQILNIVSKTKTYKQRALVDSNHTMVEVKSTIPTVVYDLRYATTNNFTHTKLYSQTEVTFLRLPVVKALEEVQTTLNKDGLGIKIFDAYRPYAVTKKMWDLIQDERYVANPAKGSGHNRGLSIDLTLINLSSGNELPMGTGFDNFTDTAHHTFKNLPATVLENRIRLKTAMENAGFKALETEWWHYSWPNDRNYEVLDLPFKKLKKAKLWEGVVLAKTNQPKQLQ